MSLELKTAKLSPTVLAGFPGFMESVEDLRKSSEHELFRDGESSFDVETYRQLALNGTAECWVVLDTDNNLQAWGVLMRAATPRRSGLTYITDVMWSATPEAGSRLIRRLLFRAGGAPLFVTVPVGGRFDQTLSDHPRLARKTHHVYTINHTV